MEDRELSKTDIDKLVEYQLKKLEKEYRDTLNAKTLTVESKKAEPNQQQMIVENKNSPTEDHQQKDQGVKEQNGHEEAQGVENNYQSVANDEDGNEDDDWSDFQNSEVNEVKDTKEVKEVKEVKELPEAKPGQSLRFKDIPLGPETVEKIKRTMAKIKMKPPAWAEKIPEEVWMKNMGF